MRVHIFICHASANGQVAGALCDYLEGSGLPCWVAPRDITGGIPWSEGIVDGINRSWALLLVLSDESNRSQQVLREVERAVDKKIPILALQIEEIRLSPALEYFLSSIQRLDALTEPLSDHFPAVVQTLRKLPGELGRPAPRPKRVARRPARMPAATASVRDVSSPPIGPHPEPRDPERESTVASFPNPYDFNRIASPRTFKGRVRELDELFDSITDGTHTAIFGLQRMGKTSLIEEGLSEVLQRHPRLAGEIVLAKVDFQRLGGEQVKYGDLVRAVIKSINDALLAAGIGHAATDLRVLTNELFRDNDQGDRSEFFVKFARLLGALSDRARRPIVLFIDEFSEVRKAIEQNRKVLVDKPQRNRGLLPYDMYLDHAFMRHLSSLLRDRDLLGKFTLIVAVRPFMAEFDERESLQILKLMKPVVLYHLDEPAAKALITEPLRGTVDYEPGVVDALYRMTAGHPYLLQFILKSLVDGARREGRRVIGVADLASIESRMVSEGPAYDAQFAVVLSDYSVDEITIPQEKRLGMGMMALIAKLGHEQEEGWVFEDQIVAALLRHGIPKEKTASLLSQLHRVKIIEERVLAGSLGYRMTIPLLRKRFVQQNLYQKYFR